MTLAKRYFLNRDGTPTGRMQGMPGEGHFEIAQVVLGPLDRNSDFYGQMFKLKYVRVAEAVSEKVFYVDAPVNDVYQLTRGQIRFIREKQISGWTIVFNSREFVESRDKRSGALVAQLINA